MEANEKQPRVCAFSVGHGIGTTAKASGTVSDGSGCLAFPAFFWSPKPLQKSSK